MSEKPNLVPFVHRGETFFRRNDGKTLDRRGHIVELFEGQYLEVANGDKTGWWRFHKHYDRDGYCDNPARGY